MAKERRKRTPAQERNKARRARREEIESRKTPAAPTPAQNARRRAADEQRAKAIADRKKCIHSRNADKADSGEKSPRGGRVLNFGVGDAPKPKDDVV